MEAHTYIYALNSTVTASYWTTIYSTDRATNIVRYCIIGKIHNMQLENIKKKRFLKNKRECRNVWYSLT